MEQWNRCSNSICEGSCFSQGITAKPPLPCAAATNVINTDVSPCSKARLSGQYIEQLKSLQELKESGVLSEEEFEEQKTFALQNIRCLNKSI